MRAPFVHRPLWYVVGPFTISGLGFAIGLALVLGYLIVRQELWRTGEDPTAAGRLLLPTALGVGVGAKLYNLLVTRDLQTLTTFSGHGFWGAFFGAGLAVVWWARRNGVALRHLADALALAFAAGYPIGRTGCWAVGDDYGRPWEGPWAVAFPAGAPPSTAGVLRAEFHEPVAAWIPDGAVLGVHPTQLYEVGLGLAVFAVVWRLRRRAATPGRVFGAYCVLLGAERFCIDFLRAKDDRVLGWLSVTQLISIALAPVGTAVLMTVVRRAPVTATAGVHDATACGARPRRSARRAAASEGAGSVPGGVTASGAPAAKGFRA